MIKSYQNIREKIFSKSYKLDGKLSQLCQKISSHRFLINPASQTIYQYLINYVAVLSECHFNLKPSEIKVLDWGCGKGHNSYFLRKVGMDVCACDIDSDADDSSFGQETPILDNCNISVLPLKHAYRLPYSDTSFDVVISVGVLEHVQYEMESIREIHRILRHNGLFFCFFLPNKLSWTQFVARSRGNHYHNRLYSQDRLKELLSDVGFQVIDVWYRQLFPKNNVTYPCFNVFEAFDQLLVKYTPFKYIVTNIEFVAQKNNAQNISYHKSNIK